LQGLAPRDAARVQRHISRLIALLGVVGVAHAQDAAGFRIALQAPEDARCVTTERLTQLVEERAGRTAARAGTTARVQVAVVIAPRAAGYRASVTVSDGRQASGQRELSADGACSALDDVLTLVIAASVGVAAPAPPPADHQDRPRLEATRPLEPVRVGQADTEPTLAWSFDLDASLRVLTGVLPPPVAGASLALWVTHGALQLGVSGTWLPPVSPGDPSELRLRMTGGWGELDVCGRMSSIWRTSFAFCTGLQVGALRAVPNGLSSGTPRWDALVQLAPSVRMQLAVLPWLGPSLAVGAAIPLQFPQYSYRDTRGAAVFYHAVELGVWAQLGLWIRFNP
jgi:hypothetical protein